MLNIQKCGEDIIKISPEHITNTFKTSNITFIKWHVVKL
jgi:hypothetical protein